MRDELNEPLGQARPRTPLRTRLRPLGAWSRRAAFAAFGAGCGGALLAGHGAATGRSRRHAVRRDHHRATPSPSPTPAASAAGPRLRRPPTAAVSVVRKGGDGRRERPRGRRSSRSARRSAARSAAAADSAARRDVEIWVRCRAIAADGARPSDVYARPFAETPLTHGAPRIAVFVGGARARPADAPRPRSRDCRAGVSLGPRPLWRRTRESRDPRPRRRARDLAASADGGRRRRRSRAAHAEDARRATRRTEDSLHWLMARFAGYVGIENYLGAKFTADADAVSPTLAEIARRGLLYLDDGSSALSKVARPRRRPRSEGGRGRRHRRRPTPPRSTPRSRKPRTSRDAAARRSWSPARCPRRSTTSRHGRRVWRPRASRSPRSRR